jgi:hypothetical protein
MDDKLKIALILLGCFSLSLLLTPLAPVVEAALALALIATVLAGFSLHPKKEVYYVQTTRRLREPSGRRALEKDFIAVKVEVVRLWILFAPTFLAVAFLVVSSAKGILWKFSLVGWIFESKFQVLLFVLREICFVIFLILQAWLQERWVLTNAEASNATSIKSGEMHVTYAFYDQKGVIYGGDYISLDLVGPRQIAKIVFYNPKKPDVNKIAMAFLFHRPVVVARGLTDLNTRTVDAQRVLAELRPRQLAPDEV